MKSRQSPWFEHRIPPHETLSSTSVTVTGLNIQGFKNSSHAEKLQRTTSINSYYFGSLLFSQAPKEKVKVMNLHLRITNTKYNYSWSISRTLDEIKTLNTYMRLDSSLGPNRKSLSILEVSFNSAATSSTFQDDEMAGDAMRLLETRDSVEESLQETFQKIDFESYDPLGRFIKAEENLGHVLRSARVLRLAIRKYLARKHLPLRLGNLHDEDLKALVLLLESGIDVFEVKPPPVVQTNSTKSNNTPERPKSAFLRRLTATALGMNRNISSDSVTLQGDGDELDSPTSPNSSNRSNSSNPDESVSSKLFGFRRGSNTRSVNNDVGQVDQTLSLEGMPVEMVLWLDRNTENNTSISFHSNIDHATRPRERERSGSTANRQGQKQSYAEVGLGKYSDLLQTARLCIAPRADFERQVNPNRSDTSAPARATRAERGVRAFTDGPRGLFLADIAEVRRGASTFDFKASRDIASWIKPSLCLSLVGSERTLNFQLSDEEDVKRNKLVDLLSLLSFMSLDSNERRLRRRRIRKVQPNSTAAKYNTRPVVGSEGIPLPVVGMSRSQYADACLATELLEGGVEVEELEQVERPNAPRTDKKHDPFTFIQSYRKKLLQYYSRDRVLVLTLVTDDDADDGDTPPVEISTTPVEEKRLSVSRRKSESMRISECRDTFSSRLSADGGSRRRISLSNMSLTTTNMTPRSSEKGRDSSSSPLDSYLNESSSSNRQADIEGTSWGGGVEGTKSPNGAGSNGAPKKILLPIDDVSEVRPGKISSYIDGCMVPSDDTIEIENYLTFVTSQRVIILPVPTIESRDRLLHMFAAFLLLHRQVDGFYQLDTHPCFDTK